MSGPNPKWQQRAPEIPGVTPAQDRAARDRADRDGHDGNAPSAGGDRAAPTPDAPSSAKAVSLGAVSEGAVSEGAVSLGAVSEGAISAGQVFPTLPGGAIVAPITTLEALARLVTDLERDPRPAARAMALRQHMAGMSPEDRLRVARLLTGQRPRRGASGAELARWAAAAADLPDWLFATCRAETGDLAEAAAQVLPDPAPDHPAPPLAETLVLLAQMAGQPEAARAAMARSLWSGLPSGARWLFNRLMTGTLRLKLPPGLVAGVVAGFGNGDPAALALWLAAGEAALSGDAAGPAEAESGDLPRPLSMPAASALPLPPESLGPATGWLVEPQDAHPPVQLVTSTGGMALWSMEGEPLDHRPFLPLGRALPAGTVIAARLAPGHLLATDLPRLRGEDLRALPFAARQARLRDLLATLPQSLAQNRMPNPPISALPLARLASWEELPRLAGPQGAILHHAAHASTRHLWQPPPRHLLAVLIYGHAGAGGGLAELSFGLRATPEGDFLPVAQLPASLPEAELIRLGSWVRSNTLERFGPVRRVAPQLVFEITFAGVEANARRKAGLMLRSPRLIAQRAEVEAGATGLIAGLRALLP